MRRYAGRQDQKSADLSSRRLGVLSFKVNDLHQKALENGQVMRRYQQFELQLLGHNGLDDLFKGLLCNAVDYFQLD